MTLTEIILTLTLGGILWQARANYIAADAAKKAADTAARQLRLAHRPFTDIRNMKVSLVSRPDGAFAVRIVLNLYNASLIFARFVWVDIVHRVVGGMDVHTAGDELDITRAPDRGFDLTMTTTELTPEQHTNYMNGWLLVEFQIRARIGGPFGEHWNLFTRQVQCKEGGPNNSTPAPNSLHGWNANYQNPPDADG